MATDDQLADALRNYQEGDGKYEIPPERGSNIERVGMWRRHLGYGVGDEPREFALRMLGVNVPNKGEQWNRLMANTPTAQDQNEANDVIGGPVRADSNAEAAQPFLEHYFPTASQSSFVNQPQQTGYAGVIQNVLKAMRTQDGQDPDNGLRGQ